MAAFCTITVVLSFAFYFLPIPRAALPFIFVLIPPAVALALLALTEGSVGVRALLRQMTRRQAQALPAAGTGD